MRVAPVELARGREIERRELFECARACPDARAPAAGSSPPARAGAAVAGRAARDPSADSRRARRCAGSRVRRDPSRTESRRRGSPRRCAASSVSMSSLDVEHRDHALHLPARHESQRRRGDHAEEPVAADHVPKQLRPLRAAARHHLAVGSHHFQRLEVRDERRCGEAAAVDVRGDRAADRQPIRAGLLLTNAPVRAGARWASRDRRG